MAQYCNWANKTLERKADATTFFFILASMTHVFKRFFSVCTENSNFSKSNWGENWLNQYAQVDVNMHFDSSSFISFSINRILEARTVFKPNLVKFVRTEFYERTLNTSYLIVANLYFWKTNGVLCAARNSIDINFYNKQYLYELEVEHSHNASTNNKNP